MQGAIPNTTVATDCQDQYVTERSRQWNVATPMYMVLSTLSTDVLCDELSIPMTDQNDPEHLHHIENV